MCSISHIYMCSICICVAYQVLVRSPPPSQVIRVSSLIHTWDTTHLYMYSISRTYMCSISYIHVLHIRSEFDHELPLESVPVLQVSCCRGCRYAVRDMWIEFVKHICAVLSFPLYTESIPLVQVCCCLGCRYFGHWLTLNQFVICR